MQIHVRRKGNSGSEGGHAKWELDAGKEIVLTGGQERPCR